MVVVVVVVVVVVWMSNTSTLNTFHSLVVCVIPKETAFRAVFVKD